jgi:hypothetical protein
MNYVMYGERGRGGRGRERKDNNCSETKKNPIVISSLIHTCTYNCSPLGIYKPLVMYMCILYESISP